MTHVLRPAVSPSRPRAVWFALLLTAALAMAASPSHAFWGLLGKAGKAASAGKAAGTAGTAGKAAVAGSAAVGGAELAGMGAKGAVIAADDAARLAGKAPVAEGGLVHASLSANAALPPEVARYLSKPAASLTPADTSRMVQVYQDLMTQAGKTGDFTAVERMPQVHAAKTLPDAAPKPPAASPVTSPTSPTSPQAADTAAGKAQGLSAGAELSLHAFRLLAHAAAAGNRDAQRQMQRRCQAAAPPGLEAEQAAMCASQTPK